MAWSVRTWRAGTMADESMLNQDIRDNLNLLAQHTHAGGSGAGAGSIGGTSGMTQFIFADGSAPSDPGGTLTALYTTGARVGMFAGGSSAGLLANDIHASQHGSGGIDALPVDTAAGTAALRTLGNSGTQAASGTHSHPGL